ncbi:glycerol-3-phosphate dehydrogenase/oxidase [Pigmentiphaga kullae]|uniref:Glycerol-3-phosphate dehydrogenase n=1 Tax=Pigmentiphaga kullae TaxID=151784 RepID=A0A4Q7NLH1_9BURK|nr:FAD-dependent oxidoreductase [Pigmentiphaga kullae]RZS85981.1 glycerol-3-phosphate dehydrogenase [Pigmentiphaga kullae]
MRIAVVGAGIIGASTAWSLARRGAKVTLIERKQPMEETSRASSKLLHGGLRYLETFQIRLVHKALQARSQWLRQAPHLCSPLELLLPLYQGQMRPTWLVGAGIKLYDLLASGSGFPKASWLTPKQVLMRQPALTQRNLLGAYSFYDAQMDDYALGKWVIERFQGDGGQLVTGHTITDFDELEQFDRIVNAAGPWAMDLRSTHGTRPPYSLDWVRGSHIVLARPCPTALFLQVPHEKRIIFVLPYKGETLVGTTEIRQDNPSNPGASPEEISYLLKIFNHYIEPSASITEITKTYSGIRPLIRSANNPSNNTREWAFERIGNVLHIYGGKWTTAQIQGEEAAMRILK